MATESTPRSRQRRHLLIAGAAVAAAARVPAQDPGPPIRLIVPYAAGGPIDVTARVLAERVRDTLGTVLIDNKGGAGGNIGADAIARAAPDGLTIGIAATATHAVNPWLYARLPYDAAKDFAGITQLVRVPNVLVMNVARAEQFGIHRLADLVAYAKAHPARLNYGSGGNGSAGHLAGEMFKQRAGIFALHIPYRGASPAQLALLAGEVDFNIDNLAAAAPNIRAGKLKALAVTSLEASPALPGVPPLADDLCRLCHRHLVGSGRACRHAPAGDRPAPPGFCGGAGRAADPGPLCRPAGRAGGLHTPAVRQLHGQRTRQVPATGAGLGRQGGLMAGPWAEGG